MTCIVFSGPDGAGKTSIIDALRAYLASKDIYSSYHWLRGSHFFASLLARFFSRMRILLGDGNPFYGITIPPKLVKVWILIEIISLLPHLVARLICSRFCGIVLCDRGIVDFIVWVAATTGLPGFPFTVLGRFLLGVARREKMVYVYASPGTLRQRTDLPWSFVSKTLPLYAWIVAEVKPLCVLNTTGRELKTVLAVLIKCLRGRNLLSGVSGA